MSLRGGSTEGSLSAPDMTRILRWRAHYGA